MIKLISIILMIFSITIFLTNIEKKLAIIPIAAINLYLISLIFAVTIKSDSRNKWKDTKFWNKLGPIMLPTKTASLFLFFIFFITIITGFSNLYINNVIVNSECQNLTQSTDSLYFSIVTITTLGYGDYIPTGIGKIYVIWELFSGILLLFCALPIFLSRISAYK